MKHLCCCSYMAWPSRRVSSRVFVQTRKTTSCLSPPVRSSPRDGFSWSLLLIGEGGLLKSKIWQKLQTLYMKTSVILWYLWELFLSWEKFQIKISEKIKHCCMSIFFSENRAVCEIITSNTPKKERLKNNCHIDLSWRDVIF